MANPFPDFLRISRSLDDGITRYLNSLLTLSNSDFDFSPSPSHIRTPLSTSRQLPFNTCQKFTQQIVFPSWHSRDKVLQYCKSVATDMESDEAKSLSGKQDQKKGVDERLDPYSSRFLPDESVAQVLRDVLRQEYQVEHIVRNRTWSVIIERCGHNYEHWEQDFTEWKQNQDKSD